MSGNVFYVGKGTKKRAWSTRNYNKEYVVEILFDGLSEQEAFNCEALLINEYGIDNLENKKKESIKGPLKTMYWYRLYQHAKDLAWLRDNIDNIDYKNKFIKEQIETIEFSNQLQAEINLLK